MDRGAWWATVHGVTEWNMPEVTEHTQGRVCAFSLSQGCYENHRELDLEMFEEFLQK